MSSRRRSRKSRRSLARRLLGWVLGIVVGIYAFCFLCLVFLRYVNPSLTTVQAQRRVEAWLDRSDYEKHSTFLPLTRIPVDLQHAVIAAEDGRFYVHRGIDWQELGKVMDENLDRGELGRGGSTITQQLTKNLFLTTHRSFLRKAAEFTLAPMAELVLPKRRILELYLNVIEWGPGVYGAEAACRYHYGISARQVSREQAARLAACIPAPRVRRPERMTRYSSIILARMGRMGY